MGKSGKGTRIGKVIEILEENGQDGLFCKETECCCLKNNLGEHCNDFVLASEVACSGFKTWRDICNPGFRRWCKDCADFETCHKKRKEGWCLTLIDYIPYDTITKDKHLNNILLETNNMEQKDRLLARKLIKDAFVNGYCFAKGDDRKMEDI